MEGDNAYFCEELGKRVPAVKRAAIKALPHMLCIHLKRFEFDYHNQTRYKVRWLLLLWLLWYVFNCCCAWLCLTAAVHPPRNTSSLTITTRHATRCAGCCCRSWLFNAVVQLLLCMAMHAPRALPQPHALQGTIDCWFVSEPDGSRLNSQNQS
jgi:hypothetical protein